MTQPQAPTAFDRLLKAFRALVRGEFPALTFFATYEYAITATDGTTVDCTPTDPTIGLPALNKVPLRADSIATQTPTPGALCHILFANGDPSKPYCVWTQPSPATATIGAKAASVAIGPAPLPLAHATPITTWMAATNTLLANLIPASGVTAGQLAAYATATAAAELLVPTTVVEGT